MTPGRAGDQASAIAASVLPAAVEMPAAVGSFGKLDCEEFPHDLVPRQRAFRQAPPPKAAPTRAGDGQTAVA